MAERTDEDVWTAPVVGDVVGGMGQSFEVLELEPERGWWVLHQASWNMPGVQIVMEPGQWAKLREGGRVVRRG